MPNGSNCALYHAAQLNSYNELGVFNTKLCEFNLYAWTKAQLEPFGINALNLGQMLLYRLYCHSRIHPI